jgi:hypothetical protein
MAPSFLDQFTSAGTRKFLWSNPMPLSEKEPKDEHEKRMLHCLYEIGKVLPPIAAASVTRVVGIQKDGSPAEHRGTALLCSLGKKQAFITADHVLQEIKQDKRFSNFGFSCMLGPAATKVYHLQDIDVAVITPRSHVRVREGKDFWPAENADDSSEPLVADYVLVHGVPARFSRFSAIAEGHVSDGYTHCTWVRPSESNSKLPLWAAKGEVPGYGPVPDHLLRPGQFAINYAEDTGPLRTLEGEEVTRRADIENYSGLYTDGVAFPGQKPFGPFGLSGSPIWRFGALEAGWQFDDWSPQRAKLAGIVTDWNENHNILIATPIHMVFSHFAQAVVSRLP